MKRDCLAAALLVLLTFSAFGRTLGNDFVTWDDPQTIARNPWFDPPTIVSLGRVWREPVMDLYAPVTYTTWWLVGQFTLKPAAFHALNIVLHAGTVVCVFFLLRRLEFKTLAAAIGAAVFTVHPVQVESVAWASGTKDVLSGLLAVAALLAYLSPRRGMYWIATAIFVLAMLAKPSAMVVPALAACIDLLVRRRDWKQVARSLAPWFVLAIPITIVAARVQPAHLAADQQVGLLLRPLVAADAIAFYLGKLLWPFHLALDYGRTPTSAWENRWLLWTWVIPVIVLAIAWRLRSRRVWLAILLFVIALSPVMGLVRTDFQYYSTVADHYLYLPMLGIALLVSSLLFPLPPGEGRVRANAKMLAFPIVGLLAILTFIQAGHWKDTPTLFARVLDVNPSSVAAYSNLAFDAAEHDRPQDAIELAQKALKLRRRNTQALTTLGSQYARLGQLDLAENAYRQAVDSAPDDARPLTNLAGLLARRGDLAAALPLARRAVDLDPDFAQARLNYGTMLAESGDNPGAIAQLEQAVKLDPASELANQNLAIVRDRAQHAR